MSTEVTRPSILLEDNL